MISLSKSSMSLVALIGLSAPVEAQILIFTNSCPADTKSQKYLASVALIASAIDAGHKIHATLRLPENNGISSFYIDNFIAKVSTNAAGRPSYVSAILPIRPQINNYAEVGNGNGSTQISGSFDSWGRYNYNGNYAESCYVISWWDDTGLAVQ